MERDGSLQGLEAFDKLSLEKARNADVEELDDEGWRIASMEKRVQELGNLGEGAGGAVTRCKLKGGKTVFALKVRQNLCLAINMVRLTRGSRSLLLILTPTSRNKSFESSGSTKSARLSTFANTMAHLSTPRRPQFP